MTAFIIGIIVIGLALVVLEIIVLPGLVSGIIGIVMIVSGVSMSYVEFGTFGGTMTLISTLIGSTVAIFLSLKAKSWNRFGLKDTLDSHVNAVEETGVEMQKFNLKMIDGKQAYETKEEAIAKAEADGCGGYHEHEVEGVIYYMPCKNHDIALKEPCWDGYEQVGTKMKDGKEVPNCVPLSTELTSDNTEILLGSL